MWIDRFTAEIVDGSCVKRWRAQSFGARPESMHKAGTSEIKPRVGRRRGDKGHPFCDSCTVQCGINVTVIEDCDSGGFASITSASEVPVDMDGGHNAPSSEESMAIIGGNHAVSENTPCDEVWLGDWDFRDCLHFLNALRS